MAKILNFTGLIGAKEPDIEIPALVICLGDNPTQGYYGGRWHPLNEIPTHPQQQRITLSRKPVVGMSNYTNRATFLKVARMYEPKFNFSTSI